VVMAPFVAQAQLHAIPLSSDEKHYVNVGSSDRLQVDFTPQQRPLIQFLDTPPPFFSDARLGDSASSRFRSTSGEFQPGCRRASRRNQSWRDTVPQTRGIRVLVQRSVLSRARATRQRNLSDRVAPVSQTAAAGIWNSSYAVREQSRESAVCLCQFL
jgi:hypothetical protein